MSSLQSKYGQPSVTSGLAVAEQHNGKAVSPVLELRWADHTYVSTLDRTVGAVFPKIKGRGWF